MATTGYNDLDDFLPQVLPYVHGCPSALAKLHIMNAAIELCRRAQVLRVAPAVITMAEDINEYKLKYSSDRYVAISADRAFLTDSDGNDKYTLGETSRGELASWARSWEQRESSRPTHFYLMEQVNMVRIYPKPSTDPSYDLNLVTRVYPQRTQTELDQQLYNKWVEIIAAGALRDLLLIPGSTWNSPRLAATYELEFRRGIQRARKTTLTGTGNHPGMVQPRDFVVQGSTTNVGGYSYDY